MIYGIVSAEQSSYMSRPMPALFVDGDVFYAPAMTQFFRIKPPFYADTDAFHTAHVGFPAQTLVPSLVTDADAFYAPAAAQFPAFVNEGTINGSLGSTSITPALPGSRVTGNLLVAFVQITNGDVSISVDNGWTIDAGLTQHDANGSSALAWLLVDGAEAAPTFSWSGSLINHAQVFQFAGNDGTSPIGATANGSGNSTTLSVSAVVTTHDASLIAAMCLTTVNQAIPVPTGYTSRSQFNDAFGSDRLFTEKVATSGASSDAVSVTISSSAWHAYLFEIKAP
jgi:hypothetical protein